MLDEPRHPYMKGLVGSFPTIHGPKTRLTGIPGGPVNLLELPQGRNFQARCTECFAPCREIDPALTEVGPGHRATCHLLIARKEDAA